MRQQKKVAAGLLFLQLQTEACSCSLCSIARIAGNTPGLGAGLDSRQRVLEGELPGTASKPQLMLFDISSNLSMQSFEFRVLPTAPFSQREVNLGVQKTLEVCQVAKA